MDQIREYFGERIALYFAFLGFYTVWLIWAAIFGLIVAIFGIINAVECVRLCHRLCRAGAVGRVPRAGLTDVGGPPRVFLRTCSGNFTVTSTGATRLFDNELTLPFAAFMSIWGTDVRTLHAPRLRSAA